jgi:peroxiredoxin
MKLIKYHLCLLIFILLQVYTVSIVTGHEASFLNMGVVSPKNEKLAPNFTLETTTGKKINLKDFKGKAVLLNFWATWCEPCKKELPSMQKIYDELKPDGIEIIGVSIDRNKKEQVKKYIRKYNLTFPILLDPNQKVRKDYFILGLPTSYLIGSDGKLKGFISGARQWDSKASKEMLSTLMSLQ